MVRARTLWLVCLFVVAASVHAQSPCTEREPNESAAAASAISIPSDCTGFAAASDASSIRIDYGADGSDGIEDVFVLTLTVPAKLTVELKPNAPGADLDLFLFTFSDRARYLVVENHDSAGTSEKFTLVNPLSPGTYYIGVSAYSGSTGYTLSLSAPGYSTTCAPDANSLCLNNGRFRVTTDWATGEASGKGRGVLLTHETGYFWFFAESNVEMVVKMIDACALNSRFWTFSGGLTDVQVTMRITDTVTGQSKTYTNPLGTVYQTITDTSAFATCSGASCTYAVSPQSQSFGASGGSASVAVSTTASCAWSATSDASWLTITSGASGTGNGNVSYAVAANASTSSRTGTMTIAGRTVTITQGATTPSCSYTVTPLSRDFGAGGGSGSIDVSTQSGCAWTAVSNSPFLSITSGASGTGNGSVSYSVSANASVSSRTGTMTIAGRTVTISQAGNASSSDHDGTWNGQTNEAEVVGFTIANGKITSFKMSFTFSAPGGTCHTTVTLNYGASAQPTVTSTGFNFTFNPTGLSTAINATFNGANSVSGTYGQVNLNNYQCGTATVNGFKSGGTFTAGK
ncbi:MAG TPA: BACON domain-containing carbohydrate-binding protein [Thermoanaerobaculia bacterium]|nr:BACON domain-containing carbohydrate-binding protein [Thermoanaerobaculia bacterium]